MSKSVAIIHGWAGGEWHTKQFVQSLQESGFEYTQDPLKADLIVAHSVGCYKIPLNIRASGLLLMGPPYWPGKSIASRLFSKKRLDNKLTKNNLGRWFTFQKTLWEGIYIVIKPNMTFFALKNHANDNFLDDLINKKVILLRNNDDFFCSPALKRLANTYINVLYVDQAGAHDDFMTNPQPYIKMLKKL